MKAYSRTSSIIVVVGIIFAALIAYAYFSPARPALASDAGTAPLHVRWLLSHPPYEVFDGAKKVLADEFQKESGRPLDVTFLKAEDVGVKNDVSVVETSVSFGLLDKGVIDMVSTDYGGIGIDPLHDNALYVLNLPFLFDDYAQAEKVLTGPVGEGILKEISDNTSGHALGFTYSGGLKVFLSRTKKIESLSDLKGMKVGTWGGAVSERFLALAGAIPVPLSIGYEHAALNNGEVEALEEPITRISADPVKTSKMKYINETFHGLFVTAIVVSDAYWDTLTPGEQTALENAVHLASATERRDSIAHGAQTILELQKQGVEVVTLSASARQAMKDWSRSIYGKLESPFSADFIRQMLAQ